MLPEGEIEVRKTTRYLLLAFVLSLSALSVLAATDEFTIEQSSDETLQYRCFLPPGMYEGTDTNVAPGPRFTVETSITSMNITRKLGPLEPRDWSLAGVISGQLVDGRGRPMGGETVEINWSDELNVSQSIRTTTLTAEEAVRLGDPTLEGYWFVSRRRVGPAAYTVTRIAKTAQQAPSAPPPAQKPPPTTPNATYTDVLVNPTKPSLLESFPRIDWRALLLILALLLAYPTYRWLRWRRIRLPRIFHRNVDVRAEMNRLISQPTHALADKEWCSTPPESTVQEVITLLVSREQDACIVSGEKMGILTASDVLRARPDQTAGMIAREAKTIARGTPFVTALALAREFRTIPLLNGTAVTGILARSRLLSQLDEFFSFHFSLARVLPSVSQTMEPPIFVEPDEKVAKITEAVADRPVVLVRTKNGLVVGMIDERSVLEELYNYRDTIGLMDTGRLATRIPARIDAAVTLLEANRILLDSKLRALPVYRGEEIVGVLTEKALLRAFEEQLLRALGTVKRT